MACGLRICGRHTMKEVVRIQYVFRWRNEDIAVLLLLKQKFKGHTANSIRPFLNGVSRSLYDTCIFVIIFAGLIQQKYATEI